MSDFQIGQTVLVRGEVTRFDSWDTVEVAFSGRTVVVADSDILPDLPPEPHRRNAVIRVQNHSDSDFDGLWVHDGDMQMPWYRLGEHPSGTHDFYDLTGGSAVQVTVVDEGDDE